MKTEKNRAKQPDIGQMTAQLARDNDRVACYLHGLTSHVDRVISASKENDWQEVRRVSEFLMRSSSVYGLSEVARSAEQVCRALDDPANTVEIKRNILKLIGRCGSAGRRQPVKSA